MMCPYKKADEPTKSTTLLLTNHAKHMITLERTSVGEEKSEYTSRRKTVWSTDWFAVTDCPRCGGSARKGGSFDGGLLTVYRIAPDGTWTGMLAACSCYFGAWHTFDKLDPDGKPRTRKIPFADDLKDVPGGLSDLDWRWLHVAREPGDGYLQAAEHMPDDGAVTAGAAAMLRKAGVMPQAIPNTLAVIRAEAKIRIVGTIERWAKGNPPRWNPEAGDNRRPEDPEQAEERPARREPEPLGEAELPF